MHQMFHFRCEQTQFADGVCTQLKRRRNAFQLSEKVTWVVNHSPFYLQYEAYELQAQQKIRFLGVWRYSIYFDFLPSFRFAKVLRYIDLSSGFHRSACQSNPCNSSNAECHILQNDDQKYVCLCKSGYSGENCSIEDQYCANNFCHPDALCKPSYSSTVTGNRLPFCLCPLGKYGTRCGLTYDQCLSSPCKNNGTCYASTSNMTKVNCLCSQDYYGDSCEFAKETIEFTVNTSNVSGISVVQCFYVKRTTLDLTLAYQVLFEQPPDHFHYQYAQQYAPNTVLLKNYQSMDMKYPTIFLLLLSINENNINVSITLADAKLCLSVDQISKYLPGKIYQYHTICRDNSSSDRPLCFFDKQYLCTCEANNYRAECFLYDHQLDRCDRCFSSGRCIRGDRQKNDNFQCLCPKCYYGTLCQYSTDGLSPMLDSLIVQMSRAFQIMYSIFALLIFLVGGMTNYASFITFKRPNLRNSGVGIYLLILSLTSQYSLLSLVMKMILVLFDSLMNDISCKIISYMLSVSIRCSFWLTSWIAIIRVCHVLFPFATLLKNSRFATKMGLVTLLIVAGMDVHELIFYLRDPSGQAACVVNFPWIVSAYDRITVLIYYLVPFCIQILSITILITLAARSRSRSNNNRDTFIKHFKRQFRSQRELYITPIVIVLSGLPQIIFSLSFACVQRATWQQHTLLIAYFLSYAPQLLGFVLFVLPSTTYIQEFRATNLSKMFLFKRISPKTKQIKR